MQVFKLLAGETVKTHCGKLCVPLPLARDGGPFFLVCFDKESRDELERQVKILKQPDNEVFSYILNYGFNSMTSIKELLGTVHGNRSRN